MWVIPSEENGQLVACMEDILDVYQRPFNPEVSMVCQDEKVCLVCDNLNIHNLGSLYETFAPEEARRLARRLEIHYTPKHGSWRNMAEIELSALSKQGLSERIPCLLTHSQVNTVWVMQRNERQKGVDWQFTTADTRIKLKRLYSLIQSS